MSLVVGSISGRWRLGDVGFRPYVVRCLLCLGLLGLGTQFGGLVNLGPVFGTQGAGLLIWVFIPSWIGSLDFGSGYMIIGGALFYGLQYCSCLVPAMTIVHGSIFS